MKKTEDIELVNFKSDILDIGFEIMSLSKLYQKFDINRRSSHIVNFYVILFITSGKGKHEINFKTYAYEENNILFINKGQQHKWIEYENPQGFAIFFTGYFLHKNQIQFKDLSYTFPYNSYLYEPLLVLEKKHINSFQHLVEYLFQEYQLPKNEHTSEILQCLLRAFLLKTRDKESLNKIATNTEQQELFIRFQKMIDDKLNQSRNINDYCEWLSVSYKKLNETCKIFTQNTAKFFFKSGITLKSKAIFGRKQKEH